MTPRSVEDRLRKFICLHGPEIVPACYKCVLTVVVAYAAEQVAQAQVEERETCAKIANQIVDEERIYQSKAFGTPGEAMAALAMFTASKIATAIRRRGE